MIEDEPLIAEFVADIAERAGATSVEIVETEKDAIAAVSLREPDVILSDVNLNVGGTGPKAIEAIRVGRPSIPVIYITGTPEECEQCDYAVAILSKPIQPEMVMAAFARAYPRS
ncbi:response regulator [Sphingomonas sp. GC_Shp_4]|uniref:response regulator n=1 Tax=Sphingomonas sp. GC_Shp_4 TaxID=2937382 RepID=UPI00226B7333